MDEVPGGVCMLNVLHFVMFIAMASNCYMGIVAYVVVLGPKLPFICYNTFCFS